MFFHALPRCSAFQMGCQPFGHQTRKHLVMISGLGLNFQLLRVYYELTKWPAPSRLDSSVGRTLHQYRRGHGFESCSGLHFFQALISQLLEGAFFSWPSERWLYIIQKMTAVIFGAKILHDKCINMVQYFSTDLLYLFSRKLAKTVQDADHFKMVDISAPSISQKLRSWNMQNQVHFQSANFGFWVVFLWSSLWTWNQNSFKFPAFLDLANSDVTVFISDNWLLLGIVYMDMVSNRNGFMTWKPHRKQYGFKQFTRNLSNR